MASKASNNNSQNVKKTPGRKGKIRKRQGKVGNKTLRRISSSSFDVGRLTSDLISTPIGKKQRTLTSLVKSKIRNKKKRKNLNRSNLMNASQNTSKSETNETIVLDSTMVEENKSSVTGPQINNQNSTRTEPMNVTLTSIPLPNSPHSSKSGRLPAGNQLVKSPQQLNHLFRNDFACVNTEETPTVSDIINNIGDKTPLPLPKILEEKSDDDIIIIDDKDETEKTENTIIQNVGEEILRLVENNDEGDGSESIVGTDRVGVETITIDDTIVEKETSDSDSVIIVPDDDESVQEIVARYHVPMTAITNNEFIPLETANYSPLSVRIQNQRNGKKKKRQVTRPQAGGVLNPSSIPPSTLNKAPTIYNTENSQKKGLRPIIIDGSNVAFSHGKSSKFSLKGIEIVIDYFKKRGHSNVVAFLPQYRMGGEKDVKDTLEDWEKKGLLVFTPSRKCGNKAINSYDDRMILDYATAKQGIVVSRDNFRDIYEESPQHRETIMKRILMPTFVGDVLMFPDDPLGRSGPRLDEFLRF